MAFRVGDRVVSLGETHAAPRVGTVVEARADEIKVWDQGVPGTREPTETDWVAMAAFRPATEHEIDVADGPAAGEPHD
jgi:hypothetical protein